MISKYLQNMDIKAITSVLFLLIIVDVDGAWSISKEEDMELEKQLKILNKPAVKTIRVIQPLLQSSFPLNYFAYYHTKMTEG